MGNIPPVMRWVDESGENLTSNTRTNTTHIESNTVVTAHHPSLQPYTALTYFEAPTLGPPSIVDPATNEPSYTFNWTSTPIPVLHGTFG